MNMVARVCAKLPKYFSRGHKAKVRKLTENLLFDRVSPAEFRALYKELPGYERVSNDSNAKDVDERVHCIMHNIDPTLARDLQVNSSCKGKFDKFWDVRQRVLDDITSVDERRHATRTEDGDIVVNISIAISVRDLFERCKSGALIEGLTEDEMPSLSWFRFQFWPKNENLHTALNYTKRFNVRNMVQQRIIQKTHEDNHYVTCIFKYVKVYACKLKDIAAMVCTDDEHKISVGEPGTQIASVPRGRR